MGPTALPLRKLWSFFVVEGCVSCKSRRISLKIPPTIPVTSRATTRAVSGHGKENPKPPVTRASELAPQIARTSSVGSLLRPWVTTTLVARRFRCCYCFHHSADYPRLWRLYSGGSLQGPWAAAHRRLSSSGSALRGGAGEGPCRR